jgi:hypothetical protein
MELTGKIIKVFETRSGVSQSTGKSWASQEAVLEIPGQYPKHMVFTVFGEDNIKNAALYVGADVNVLFDIDAREYQGKYYNSIKAYKVVHMDAQQPAPVTPPQQPAAYQQPLFSDTQSAGSANDLPF